MSEVALTHDVRTSPRTAYRPLVTEVSFLHVVLLVLALAWVALVVWAIVRTVRDRTVDRPMKIAWVLVLVLIPVVGLVLWLIVRMVRTRHTTGNS